jgi:hypothetical protein
MAKKELIYRGLADLPVLIVDKTATSPDYLRVTKLPTELNAGINIFKFKGNLSLFAAEAEFDVEILDSNGDPIYFEVGLDLESAEQSAVVTIYINQDTAPGSGRLYACTTLAMSADGKPIDSSNINFRWEAPIYIDVSKPNSDDIIFSALPVVNISPSSGSYTNYSYGADTRSNIVNYTQAGTKAFKYLYRNGNPVIVTGSGATQAFSSSVESAIIAITSTYISNGVPSLSGTVSNITFTSSLTFSGSGIAYLADPISYPILRSTIPYEPTAADISDITVTYIQSTKGTVNVTENSHNLVIAYFSRLQPQSGTVSKIRSYYRSTGVEEYIFSNETAISFLADEFGFTPNIVSASFAIPTVQRNDRIDFKFEFINPAGVVSKQVVESLNNLFIGGNTYIGGDDNLLTGSLYVAGSTGTGVHISGKGSSAMIRSIGYAGFQNATTIGPGGFVMYSGSIQPLLGAIEDYNGVGLELVANSASYFKYTTSGSGLLDIRTANFFLGNESNSISGSNGNITISGSNVSISTDKFFLGNQSTFISGSNGNILISGSNINILTPSFNLGTSASYVSGSSGKINIYSNKFILTGEGIVTASGIFVPKAFFSDAAGTTFTGNFGYGTGIVPMIEPDKVFIDATNIGRCVAPSDSTEYTYNLSGSSANSPVFKTVTFHTMANETRYTVASQLKVAVAGVGSLTSVGIDGTVLVDVYYIQSGSNTGLQAGTYDVWSTFDTDVAITNILNPATMAAGTTYERVNTGRRLIQLPIPSPITGSGGQMQLQFKFRNGSGAANITSSFYTKYIEVLSGRDIGLNFKENFLGTPIFSAIGSSPGAGGGAPEA